MPATEPTGSAGLAGLQTVLAGLDLKPEQLDDHAKQRAAVLAFGRRTTVQPSVTVLMEDAVSMIAEVIGTNRIGVGEVVRGGTAIAFRAATLDQRGGLSGTIEHEYSILPTASMAGFALDLGTPVTSADLGAERRFTDLFLRNLQVTSALALPLHLNGKPFGALGVYTGGERPFNLEDVQFAETIAHLLTSSLARVKAEEELDQQRSFASAILEMVDTLVLTLDADGRVVGMNRASQQVTGFEIEEIRERPFWSVFVVPEELDLIRGIFRSARNERAPCEFEGYLMTKEGSKKRVSWSLKLMSDGKVQSIILSGVDQTPKIEMQTELRQVKSIAARATKALKELCAMTEAAPSPPGPDGTASTRATTPAEKPDSGQDLESLPFQPVGAVAPNELRRSIRRTYHYLQKVAPVMDDRQPRPDQFFEVQCNDISAGGLSFFFARPPAFERLIVALGKEPAVTYFTAHVVRVASVERGGGKAYLVGCKFTGRTQL